MLRGNVARSLDHVGRVARSNSMHNKRCEVQSVVENKIKRSRNLFVRRVRRRMRKLERQVRAFYEKLREKEERETRPKKVPAGPSGQQAQCPVSGCAFG